MNILSNLSASAIDDRVSEYAWQPKTEDDLESIYQRARKQFSVWKNYSVQERMVWLRKLRYHIAENRDRIANVIHQATGKPVFEALSSEVMMVLESLRFLEKHAEKLLRPQKRKTPMILFGKKSYLQFQPRGIVLVISPWNFPFQLAMVPVIEALAAGNCVLLKPSEWTPSVTELMQSLFHEVGFPEGVVQVIMGDGKTGRELIQKHPDFIHFTGSVATGRRIQSLAAEQLIPTTLELGGKDPMIVFADAHLERAVRGALWGAFCNSGQVCLSVERLYVERSILPVFQELLIQSLAQLCQGEDIDADLGSMTTMAQIEKVKSQVLEALQRGATLLAGEHPDHWLENSRKLAPVLITNVPNHVSLLNEETFGPILPILPFDQEDEVIELANQSRLGLGASVWTADLQRAKRVAAQLVTGNVCLNDVIISIANPYLPYGGTKEGGIGKYHGAEGLYAFSIQTSILLSKGKSSSEMHWFPYAGKSQPLSQLIDSWYGKQKKPFKLLQAYMKLLNLSRKRNYK